MLSSVGSLLFASISFVPSCASSVGPCLHAWLRRSGTSSHVLMMRIAGLSTLLRLYLCPILHLFRNACSCLVSTLVYPFRFIPNFLYPHMDLLRAVGVDLACELPQSWREDFLERFEQRLPVVSQSPCPSAARPRLVGCCPAALWTPHHTRPVAGSALCLYSTPLPCRARLLVFPTSLERNGYASAAADHRFCMRPTSSAASVNSSSSSNHWVSRSCFLSTTWLLQSKCLRHGPMLILHSAIAPATYIVSVRIVLWMLLFEAIHAVHKTDQNGPTAAALLNLRSTKAPLGLADHRTAPIHRITSVFIISSCGISHSPCTQTASRCL